jgi:hypothetical protein
MCVTDDIFYFIFMSLSLNFRPLFTEVQLLNSSSRNALVPVLPLSPENSQNNPPHPADIHPAYRIGYMQLLHTLHNATSPQSSLHGKSSEKSL